MRKRKRFVRFFRKPGFLPEDVVTMFVYPVSGYRETDGVVFVTGNGVAGRGGKHRGKEKVGASFLPVCLFL